MATYLEIYNLRYGSSSLKNRVTVAISKAATDVLNENPTTPNHANRVTWANRALGDTIAEAERMMWGVVSNATIQAAGEASTDNDIQFVVNGLVDAYSVIAVGASALSVADAPVV